MPKTSFFVNEPKTGNPTIYVNFNHGKLRVKRSTQQIIDLQYWDTKNKKVKNVQAYKRGAYITALMNRIESELSNLVTKCLLENVELNRELIENVIDFQILGKSNNKSSFLDFFEKYINEPHVPTWGASKEKSYKSVLSNLKQFAIEIKTKDNDVLFKDINTGFFKDFISFLYSIKRAKINTVSTYASELKAVLDKAKERGFDISDDVKYFSVKSQEPDRYIPTPEQVESIWNLDKVKVKVHGCDPKNPTYEWRELKGYTKYVRDLFILECETSLRAYSDIMRLDITKNIEQRDGRKFLVIVPKKTINSKNVIDTTFIPLSDRALQILNHYKVFREIDSQMYKRNIKVLFQSIEIEQNITLIKNFEGSNKPVETQIFNEITSHTARHYYITSKLSAGVPREIIAGIVGIDERTIATYNHAKSADFAKLAVEKYGL
jgi:hypothetical protein